MPKRKNLTRDIVNEMTWEQKVSTLKTLTEKFFKDNKKISEKNNKSAAERARRNLIDIKELLIPLGKDILNKKKQIPVKKRNK